MATTVAKCVYCDEEKDAESLDLGVCDECLDCGDFDLCYVCNTWHHAESRCRHLFWDGDQMNGAGAYEGDWESLHGAFDALLRVLKARAPDVPGELASALRKNSFRTFSHGSMLGPETVDFITERGGRTVKICSLWPETWDGLDGDEWEQVRNGMGWLQTLLNKKTAAANAVTVKWIEKSK